MKSLRTSLVMLLTLSASIAYSQTTARPKVFEAYPKQLNASTENFKNVFNSKQGETVSFTFSDNFKFSGKVISNVVKYHNLQSMTVRSEEFGNAIFHLSKQINDDKSISYVGRIMGQDASDGYMMKQNAEGYVFNKIEQENIRQVCSY